MDLPSQQPTPPPQPVIVPPPPSGCGCLGVGCASILGVMFVGLLLLLAGTWFFYGKAIDMFTSDAPVEVAMSTPTPQERASAQSKMAELRSAMRSHQATTIRLSARDVNALIAEQPDSKSRVRFDISDGRATIDMSVPLDDTPWPRLKGRWFNGRARFGLTYDENGFDFDPDWIEAKDHHFSGSFVRAFGSSFSRSFTSSFEKAMQQNNAPSFRDSVKSIVLEGDEMVITTRGNKLSV